VVVGRFVAVRAVVIVPCLIMSVIVRGMVVTVLIMCDFGAILSDVIVASSIKRLAGLAFCAAFYAWAMLAAATAATASAPASAPWSTVAFWAIIAAISLAWLSTLLCVAMGRVEMGDALLAGVAVGTVIMAVVIGPMVMSQSGLTCLIGVLGSWSAITFWAITVAATAAPAAAAASVALAISLTISLAITLAAVSLTVSLAFAGAAVGAIAILVVADVFDLVKGAITSVERLVAVCAGILAIKAPIHADSGTIRRACCNQRNGATFYGEVGALHAVAGLNGDGDAITALDVEDEAALIVENVERDDCRGENVDRGARVFCEMIFQAAQHGERHAFGRADHAGADAVRALRGGAFEHAGAHALAAHFHEAKVRDAAHLDAGAVET
jgi:hypothetical protein